MTYSPRIVSQPQEVIWSVASANFVSAGLVSRRIATSGMTWSSINDPIAVLFRVVQTVVVYQLGWHNATSPGGNVDVGIYDTSWTRKVSTGSTAGTGNSLAQFVDVTDTTLTPGSYYLAMALDNVTANRVQRWAVVSQQSLAVAGVKDSTTDAFPLPNPLTNMVDAATFTELPVIYMGLRAVV